MLSSIKHPVIDKAINQVEPVTSAALSGFAPAQNLIKAVVRKPERNVSTSNTVDWKNTHTPISDTGNDRYNTAMVTSPNILITPLPARERKCLFLSLDNHSILQKKAKLRNSDKI